MAGRGLGLCAGVAGAQTAGLEGLATLTPGRTKAGNALWIEDPLTAQFKTSKRVVWRTSKLSIRALNARKGSNAVLSIVEWVQK